MAETEKDTKPAGTESHDPDHPEKLLEFMRTGWLDTGLDVAPVPQAPHYAKRRAAVAKAFPGEALVIPTGTERVRANDTVYPFRPGTDFAYLTGDHDPDSVLIIRPGGEATLYMRPRSPRDTDEFFRSRHGELWVGRRHTLTEKATELGVETAHLDALPGGTRRSCTGPATPATPAPASCCSWTWAWRTGRSTLPM